MMSEESKHVTEVLNTFEYPMLDPVSVPLFMDDETLHIRGGPISGPAMTISEKEGQSGDLERLVDLLDGESHVEEILNVFDDTEPADIASVLLELYEADAIRDAGVNENWTIYDHEPLQTEMVGFSDEPTPLVEQSLAIINVGPIGKHVAAAAHEMGVGDVTVYQPDENAAVDVPATDRLTESTSPVEDAVEENDFLVYVADRPSPEIERRIDQHAHETNTPWLVGQRLGYDVFVGPAIYPGLTGCYHCFKERLANRATPPEGMRSYWNADHTTQKSIREDRYEPVSHMVAGILTHDLGNHMKFGVGYLSGRVISAQLHNLNMTANRVTKLPRCDVCGVDPGGQYNPLMKRDDVLQLFDIESR